jgi:hypothetical protein
MTLDMMKVINVGKTSNEISLGLDLNTGIGTDPTCSNGRNDFP